MATAIQPTTTPARARGGRRSRFTAEQRRQLVERAVLRLADGVSLQQSAKEVGVSSETFRRWRMEQSGSTRLRPVKAKPRATPSRSEQANLRMVTTAGHRIEGLELAQLIELVRTLG